MRRFHRWLFVAMVAYLGATAALRWRSSFPLVLRWLPWLLVPVVLVLAAQAIRCYLDYLRAADELLRRIEIEALAFGFAAGAVFSLFYPLVEGLGAPAPGRNAGALVLMLAWAAGSWLGNRRYRGPGAP